MIKKLIEEMNEAVREDRQADLRTWELPYNVLDNWRGRYADADTFLKQAEIAGHRVVYDFPKLAERLVNRLGRDKKYRLTTNSEVYVKGVSKDIDLDALKSEVGADEVWFVKDELRIWWD